MKILIHSKRFLAETLGMTSDESAGGEEAEARFARLCLLSHNPRNTVIPKEHSATEESLKMKPLHKIRFLAETLGMTALNGGIEEGEEKALCAFSSPSSLKPVHPVIPKELFATEESHLAKRMQTFRD